MKKFKFLFLAPWMSLFLLKNVNGLYIDKVFLDFIISGTAMAVFLLVTLIKCQVFIPPNFFQSSLISVLWFLTTIIMHFFEYSVVLIHLLTLALITIYKQEWKFGIYIIGSVLVMFYEIDSTKWAISIVLSLLHLFIIVLSIHLIQKKKWNFNLLLAWVSITKFPLDVLFIIFIDYEIIIQESIWFSIVIALMEIELRYAVFHYFSSLHFVFIESSITFFVFFFFLVIFNEKTILWIHIFGFLLMLGFILNLTKDRILEEKDFIDESILKNRGRRFFGQVSLDKETRRSDDEDSDIDPSELLEYGLFETYQPFPIGILDGTANFSDSIEKNED